MQPTLKNSFPSETPSAKRTFSLANDYQLEMFWIRHVPTSPCSSRTPIWSDPWGPVYVALAWELISCWRRGPLSPGVLVPSSSYTVSTLKWGEIWESSHLGLSVPRSLLCTVSVCRCLYLPPPAAGGSISEDGWARLWSECSRLSLGVILLLHGFALFCLFSKEYLTLP